MKKILLSPELVARAHRDVPDTGLPDGVTCRTDAELEEEVRRILAGRRPGEPFWLFAYGSLLWKPVGPHEEERIAVARGWHRSFRLKLSSWRGTPDHPGLMMVLDRGGQCRGVAQRLPEATLWDDLLALVRREMPVRHQCGGSANQARWIGLTGDGAPTRALAFVADRGNTIYAGRVPLERTVEMIATACGHAGSCAEYLQRTVEQLAARGIHDRNLWRLQALVAERLKALPETRPG
ncbi:gamma-glutamylcyclotransferase [Falsiroseomonas sp. HW251]|uniref:gamma-glutamylcyclotransferase n=1 Tax=Falsiroseomonas sp. HW251 TaxID=3390998 RepID=UPI003D31382A